jgi:colicin import membrane protein
MATQTVTQPEQTTALAVIQSLTPARLFEAGVIDPILERIQAEVRAVQTDISTEAGRKAVASLAFKVARSKTFIDDQRKALVSDEKKRLAAIDKEGKRVWDILEALQREVRQPLTEWEQKEAARIAALEAAVNEIANSGPYTLQNWQSLSVECMQDRIREIENTNPGWQEFEQRAKYAKTEAIAAITFAIEKRKASDAEKEELARLRKEASEREQKERDDRIAREAAEKAQRQAEQKAKADHERAERESREREESAIRAQKEAEAKAAKAEQDAKDAVQRERDRVEREKALEAAAEVKREANKRHVAKVNREAIAAIVKLGFDEESGKSIVTAIAKGDVPHVSISY